MAGGWRTEAVVEGPPIVAGRGLTPPKSQLREGGFLETQDSKVAWAARTSATKRRLVEGNRGGSNSVSRLVPTYQILT